MAWAITLLKRYDTDKAFHRDYTLEAPQSPIDKKRPAYGGTCVSPMAPGRDYIVTKYDTTSLLGTVTWSTDAIKDHAYAHPIDGYHANKVVLTTDSSGSVSFDCSATRWKGTTVLTNAIRLHK